MKLKLLFIYLAMKTELISSETPNSSNTRRLLRQFISKSDIEFIILKPNINRYFANCRRNDTLTIVYVIPKHIFFVLPPGDIQLYEIAGQGQFYY